MTNALQDSVLLNFGGKPRLIFADQILSKERHIAVLYILNNVERGTLIGWGGHKPLMQMCVKFLSKTFVPFLIATIYGDKFPSPARYHA